MVKYEFPRPALTVDLVAFRVNADALEVLLIRREEAPFKGSWTLAGGFVHDGESLEETAHRVLKSKADLGEVHIEQLQTFGDPDRDPRERVITVAYFALLQIGKQYDGPGQWFAVDELPKTGFDHERIIATAIERLRAKIAYSDIGFHFMPEEFTLTELQRCFEAVLDESLDKRNFRKSMQKQERVIETGRKSKGGAHPPAMIYRHRSTDKTSP